jgi:hypothetical protein
LAPFLFVTLALCALSYRYIEFGRERNWKALFLVARPGQKENIPVTKTPDHEGSAQGTSSDTQLEPIASQTEKDSTLKKKAAT